MEDGRITPNAVKAYNAMVALIGVDRRGHLTHAEIAQKAGLDIYSVGPALFRLHWAGFIERGERTTTGRYYKVLFNPRTMCVMKPRQPEPPRPRRRRASNYL